MSSQLMIESAIRSIIIAIGEDPDREGLIETPKRVAKMFLNEIFTGLNYNEEDIINQLSKTFTDDNTEEEKFGDMVIVKDIPFYSTCEHHFVPFFGKAHVGYIPNGKVIGLSKIARLVEIISKRPQLQERISKLTADIIVKMLDPIGVIVVIEAEHLCMSSRGIKKPGSKTVTSATRGAFKDDFNARQEFLQLIRS